jgi:hypothetical protein
MEKALGKKIANVTLLASKLRKRMGLREARAPSRGKRLWSTLSGKSRRLREYEVALQYYKGLHREATSVITAGKISYQQTYELSYFFSRAIGHFDTRALSIKDRMLLPIDRHLQGYKQLRISREFKMYKNREFKVFQKNSPVDGFKEVSKSFERAFKNPNKLEAIIVPTGAFLGTDVFMRLLSHDIFLIGVTPKPVRADGFVRPGGDFWMHDIRHSSSIFGRKKAYEKQNKLTPKATRALQGRMDVWRSELKHELRGVTDKKLKAAIRMMSFNYHHDRGYPMVPSSYLAKSPGKVPYLLYLTLKVSGQLEFARFDKPLVNMRDAHKWLRSFWLKRLSQEEQITGHKYQAAP